MPVSLLGNLLMAGARYAAYTMVKSNFKCSLDDTISALFLQVLYRYVSTKIPLRNCWRFDKIFWKLNSHTWLSSEYSQWCRWKKLKSSSLTINTQTMKSFFSNQSGLYWKIFFNSKKKWEFSWCVSWSSRRSLRHGCRHLGIWLQHIRLPMRRLHRGIRCRWVDRQSLPTKDKEKC